MEGLIHDPQQPTKADHKPTRPWPWPWNTINALLPSPITGSWPQSSPHRTAYLDGLRGLASLAVVLSHTLGKTNEDLNLPYGVTPPTSPPSSTGKSPLKLPFIRLLHAGNAAVAIFFVVSGHTLSHRILRRARARDYSYYAPLSADLSSSVLRRAARLLLPTVFSSCLVAILAQLGAFEHAIPSPETVYLIFAKRMASLTAQLGYWWTREIWRQLLAPWPGPLETVNLAYGYQLWTIPVELWCSFRLFLHLLALSRVRTRARMFLVGVSAAYHIAHARWDVFLFLAGMLTAELQLIAPVSTSSPSSSPVLSGFAGRVAFSPKRKLQSFALLVVGLFLMSEPETYPDKSPFWAFLNRFVPASFGPQSPDRFWNAVGAPLAVYAAGDLGFVRSVLESRAAQYLGRISFGLYLVHNAVFCSLGAWLLGFESINGNLAILVVVLPVALWVGELFSRFFDEPVVRLVKWAEKQCLVDETG
ncbi:hypothetical protein SODALDRAFT_333622 [Sodiomyces alkalinus F11]|uniref:Acyltransferase 3 domain-containing protein n=1 Tax=Sodiomyces alkalinus (strain CBS 110278 / VKM F-3762 / F11) TaxID=1314773 RepID=A0A3N2PTN3_SODAK|nr:hypothetical protein SODALDRAFT_333622 [Sodiomyces alkalinus F11]ROT37862.1 hypothetical protein SODALDRAFT_333622 [Sodiomyces alkalinus F11]